MAEIEKGLPGETRTQVKVPAEDIEIKEEVQQEKPPVEVIPEEDGGATIDFEPGAINIPGTEKHFAGDTGQARKANQTFLETNQQKYPFLRKYSKLTSM